MARGPYYTEEQDKALLNLYNDMKKTNPKAKNVDVADAAIRYNIAGCADRSREGLAQRISFLTNPPKEVKESASQEFDIETEMLRAENKELRRRLEGILDAVVGQATLYDNNERLGLCLNYPAINSYLWRNETERVNARIEALQALKEAKKRN